MLIADLVSGTLLDIQSELNGSSISERNGVGGGPVEMLQSF
jgi:hypothetical protein